MSPYVDGFVVAVPLDQLDNYCRISHRAGQLWREHGALEYRECAGDDLEVEGTGTFPALVSLKPGETVIFAWIVFKDRAHRDEVNAAVMADERMKELMSSEEMPCDSMRMTYGGFKTVVEV